MVQNWVSKLIRAGSVSDEEGEIRRLRFRLGPREAIFFPQPTCSFRAPEVILHECKESADFVEYVGNVPQPLGTLEKCPTYFSLDS